MSQQTRYGRSAKSQLSSIRSQFRRLQFPPEDRFGPRALLRLAKGTDYAYGEKLLYWRAAFPSPESLLLLDQFDLQVFHEWGLFYARKSWTFNSILKTMLCPSYWSLLLNYLASCQRYYVWIRDFFESSTRELFKWHFARNISQCVFKRYERELKWAGSLYPKQNKQFFIHYWTWCCYSQAIFIFTRKGISQSQSECSSSITMFVWKDIWVEDSYHNRKRDEFLARAPSFYLWVKQ